MTKLTRYYSNDLNEPMYMACEADKVIGDLESHVKELEAEIENTAVDNVDANMEIVHLKEERRWRKFSEENPEHHQWILVFYKNHSQFTTGVELRRWDNGCKYDVEVQGIYEKWMPLPKAPEEA